MNRFEYYSRKQARTCVCSLSVDDDVVLQGAAYTPAEMSDLVEQGIPVSSPSMQLLPEQGEPNPSWDIDLANRRGTDVADLWVAQREARQRLNDSYKRQRGIDNLKKAEKAAADAKLLAEAKALQAANPKAE